MQPACNGADECPIGTGKQIEEGVLPDCTGFHRAQPGVTGKYVIASKPIPFCGIYR
jgi:hypothetical protein